MKDFKKWLNQALLEYNIKRKKTSKKDTIENTSSKDVGRVAPNPMLLLTYIIFIDILFVFALVTIFIINIL